MSIQSLTTPSTIIPLTTADLDKVRLNERRRESAICFSFQTKKAVFKTRGKHRRVVEDSVDAEPCSPQWGMQAHQVGKMRRRVRRDDHTDNSWKNHRRRRWRKTMFVSALGTTLTARY